MIFRPSAVKDSFVESGVKTIPFASAMVRAAPQRVARMSDFTCWFIAE